MELTVWTLRHILLLNFAQLQNRPPDAGPPPGTCAACGTCGAGLGAMILVPIAIIVLNVALLVWVARDAKARGLDNAVMWMVLVMFTSVIGLVIYIFARPQGQLIKCQNCNNNRLQASAKCPSCGNP
jgi:uncharacterized membrane protein YhaH (DUF805 family)